MTGHVSMSTLTLSLLLLGLIQNLIGPTIQWSFNKKPNPLLLAAINLYGAALVPWISALQTLFPFHCSTMNRNHERILTSAFPFSPLASPPLKCGSSPGKCSNCTLLWVSLEHSGLQK